MNKNSFFTLYIILLLTFNAYSQEVQQKTFSDGVVMYSIKNKKSSATFNILENIQGLFIRKNKPFKKTIAFLVGVSKYDYLNELPKVPTDIEKLKNFLLKSGGVDEVYIAMEEVATPKLIRYYMSSYFPNKLTKDDRLIFFFSGHGDDNNGSTGYIQFKKSKKKVFYENVVAVNETIEWGEVNQAKHILFLFDSCSSGLAFNSKGDNYDKLLATLSGEGSRIVITAGDRNQKTYDGWFVSALMKAFKKSNEIFITASDIYSTIQKEIGILSAIHNRKLTPRKWEFGKQNGTFVFVNPNKVDKKIRSAISTYLIEKGDTLKKTEFLFVESLIEKSSLQNMTLVAFDSLRFKSDVKQNWITDVMKLKIKNFFFKNSNLIVIPSEIIQSNKYPEVTEIIVKLKEKEKYYYDESHTLSMLFEIKILKLNNTIYRANLLYTKSASSLSEALNKIYAELNLKLQIELDQHLAYEKIMVTDKNNSDITLNKGLFQQVYDNQYFYVLDTINMYKKALLRIYKSEYSESKAFPIWGQRNISKGDLLTKIENPKLNSWSIGFLQSYMPFTADINTNYSFSKNKLSINTTELYVGYQQNINKIKPSFYIRIGGIYGDLSGFTVGTGLGLNFDILKGYISIKPFLGIGFITLSHDIEENIKNSILNSLGNRENWFLEDTATSNSYYLNNGISAIFHIDNKERFFLNLTLGIKTFSEINKKWTTNYYTGEEYDGYGGTSYEDEQQITLIPEWKLFNNISTTNIYTQIGVSYFFW